MGVKVQDAFGRPFGLEGPARRIVSLIPSITETLFSLGAGDRVVGVSKFCTEPPEKIEAKTKVGGQKNPRLDAIVALKPDLVITNVEEIATACEAAMAEVERAVAGRARVRVFCPIWRGPYMTVNHDTYVNDVLHTCGGENIFRDRPDRYPTVALAEMAALKPEVILLPDEPFPFGEKHLDDFRTFPDVPAVRAGRLCLLDGKMVSWYGPRIAESLRTLTSILLTSC